ncbi:uncharacterized protein N7529_003446 [Penicillium soppii]|uniref:uncharacterized protein n=1 Tax=Penicillium soppii TaxID=69789 RepID=UPI002547CE2B|nr:uncharacterized protein N7529_003446 [Penicillium soppii]KAJ5871093.1 hypothetical protein N7529_003446 [Penicillium soppii]
MYDNGNNRTNVHSYSWSIPLCWECALARTGMMYLVTELRVTELRVTPDMRTNHLLSFRCSPKCPLTFTTIKSDSYTLQFNAMGRTVLITGCSEGGMGAALAKEFQQQGDRVFATARNVSKMASLKAMGIETLILDVTSEDSIQACISQVSSVTGGSLDILVNNAGKGLCMPAIDLSIQEAKEIFDLNFWAILRMSQVCLPLLQQAARAHGHALLVNQTSVSSVLGAPFWSAYNTSKAAAAMLIQNMRLELAPFGIKVIDLKTGGEIEKFSTGDMNSAGQEPGVWAKNVVSDLKKHNPSNIIWRGKSSTQIWLASHLPTTTLDSTMKKVASLDVLEKRIHGKTLQ